MLFEDESGSRKAISLTIQPTIMETIKGGKLVDMLIEEIKYQVLKDKQPNFFISKDGVLGYKSGRIYESNDEEVKK